MLVSRSLSLSFRLLALPLAFSVSVALSWRTAPAGAQTTPLEITPTTESQALAPQPLSPEAFSELLQSGDLEALNQACQDEIRLPRQDQLRQLQQRLLNIHPAPQPLQVVLANAEALINCVAPEAAMAVLNRYGPASGAEQVEWLLLQWRAARAAMDHRRAALALLRLKAGQEGGLEAIALPLQQHALSEALHVTREALRIM